MSKSMVMLAALAALGGALGAPLPANAVVYCKAVGVPKGCVARPAAPVAVAHPATARPVVYCKRVGVPKGCVMR